MRKAILEKLIEINNTILDKKSNSPAGADLQFVPQKTYYLVHKNLVACSILNSN